LIATIAVLTADLERRWALLAVAALLGFVPLVLPLLAPMPGLSDDAVAAAAAVALVPAFGLIVALLLGAQATSATRLKPAAASSRLLSATWLVRLLAAWGIAVVGATLVALPSLARIGLEAAPSRSTRRRSPPSFSDWSEPPWPRRRFRSFGPGRARPRQIVLAPHVSRPC
jgi:hypothetical protein